jgi:hypothetical protein
MDIWIRVILKLFIYLVVKVFQLYFPMQIAVARLEKKTFWRCCSYKKGYLDAFYDIYIDSQTGGVLYVDGMGPRVKRWRELHGMGE